MGRNKRCWVQVENGKVARILRTPYADVVNAEWLYKDAVASVREQVFERANAECQKCGNPITYNGFHMHERIPRGRRGEISVANCWALCSGCHITRLDAEHADRRTRFGETNG